LEVEEVGSLLSSPFEVKAERKESLSLYAPLIGNLEIEEDFRVS